MDTSKLKQRTLARSVATWSTMNPISCMGILNPADSEETISNELNVTNITNVINIVDDDIRIKEEQLNDSVELSKAKLDNQLDLTNDKIETARSILAIKDATNEYTLSSDRYVSSVKDLIADARDYAFTIEKKNIPLGLLNAEIAEEKADARVKELDAEILLEGMNKKKVEIDILKTQLDVARADVKIIMSEVAISEANLNIAESKIQLAMVDIERVTLLSDIAMIYADISTKKLTETRYNVESSEIEADYERISKRLDAMLEILDLKQESLIERIDMQKGLLVDVESIYAAQRIKEGIKIDIANADQELQEHIESKTWRAVGSENSAKGSEYSAKASLSNARSSGTQTVNKAAISAASIPKEVVTNSENTTTITVDAKSEIIQAISS